MERKTRAVAIKRFDVAQASVDDTHGPKSGVVMRLYIQDVATGKLHGSDLIVMEASDAMSLAQLLLHHAQQALADRESSQGPQH